MKIVTIVGARPQFVKAATVSRRIAQYNQVPSAPSPVTEVIVHTGQHYDRNMSQVFFDQLNIPRPRYHLEVGSGSHGQMTGAMLAKVEAVLIAEEPDQVLVYGDTNSTLAGALAASKLSIPVAHVEAGLRSFNRQMPEEVNRVLTDHVSDTLFCPTDTAVSNLMCEGVTEGVSLVGDVMYDAFLYYSELAWKRSTILSDMSLIAGSYKLATIHRQENTDDPERLTGIFEALARLARGGCPVIVPLHPRTRKMLHIHDIRDREHPHIRLIPPVSYLDMIALECNAQVILTDSGGIQKEAYFAKVPCITLREETEWEETIKAGWNCLGGADCCRIVEKSEEILCSRPSEQPAFYGNGNASLLILSQLLSGSCKGASDAEALCEEALTA